MTELGESRPQELWTKAEAVADLSEIRWHLVGNLQRNKVRRTLPYVALVHSVDSVRLLAEVNRVAKQLQLRLGLNIAVKTVAPGTLPRFEAKGNRFVDNR